MIDDVTRMLMIDMMFKLGIAPMLMTLDSSSTFSYRANINEALSKLPPDEATKMKRKFRKMWRSLSAKRQNDDDASPSTRKLYHVSEGKHPSHIQMCMRKQLVIIHVMDEVDKLKKTMNAVGSVNAPNDGLE